MEMEAQLGSMAVFRLSALLGLGSVIFLLTADHRFSILFTSGEFAGQSNTRTSLTELAFGTSGPKSCLKMTLASPYFCQQRAVQSALEFSDRWQHCLWTLAHSVDYHQWLRLLRHYKQGLELLWTKLTVWPTDGLICCSCYALHIYDIILKIHWIVISNIYWRYKSVVLKCKFYFFSWLIILIV